MAAAAWANTCRLIRFRPLTSTMDGISQCLSSRQDWTHHRPRSWRPSAWEHPSAGLAWPRWTSSYRHFPDADNRLHASGGMEFRNHLLGASRHGRDGSTAIPGRSECIDALAGGRSHRAPGQIRLEHGWPHNAQIDHQGVTAASFDLILEERHFDTLGIQRSEYGNSRHFDTQSPPVPVLVGSVTSPDLSIDARLAGGGKACWNRWCGTKENVRVLRGCRALPQPSPHAEPGRPPRRPGCGGR